ncbi:MAG: hypothetical protein BAJATHORv1_120046 [Candidatus Thorarchaeota archaeon]|nr:MAG: hypothetical protein BAJATHORv1_120046 [Candidatus Thorarchaeota archaeon]
MILEILSYFFECVFCDFFAAFYKGTVKTLNVLFTKRSKTVREFFCSCIEQSYPS